MIHLRHTMIVCAALLFSSPSYAVPTSAAKLVAKLAQDINCKKGDLKLFRVWCIAAAFPMGRKPTAPVANRVLFGMTARLLPGKPMLSRLRTSVTPSAMVISVRRGKIYSRIIDVKPDNADEKKQLFDALVRTSAYLKGKIATVKLPKGLYKYLQGQAAKAPYAVRPTANEWRFTGKSDAFVRKVGKHWVAIERPHKGKGIFLSMYADAIRSE